jgi:DNA-binding transcriptional ArsR family regulator
LDLVKVFKVLGSELRFQIFRQLLHGEIQSCCGEIMSFENGCCVTDLTSKYDMPQSTISHHLAQLADAGLVRMEKRGPWSVYLLDREAVQSFQEEVKKFTEIRCC